MSIKLITFTLIIATCICFDYTEKDLIVPEIKFRKIDKVINEKEFVFILFCEEKNPACVVLLRSIEMVYENLLKANHPISMYHCNITNSKEAYDRFLLRSIPAFRFFTNGKDLVYKGSRNADMMTEWLIKRMSPLSEEVKDEEDLNRLSNQKLSCLLLTPPGDKDAVQEYQNLASIYEDIPFKHSHDQHFYDRFNIEHKHAFIVFRNFDDGRKFLVSDKPFVKESMYNFLEHVKWPRVLQFTEDVVNMVLMSRKPTVVLFSDDKDDYGHYVIDEVAKKPKHRMLFVIANSKNKSGELMMKFFGIEKEDFPLMRIIGPDHEWMVQYKVDEITVDGLNRHIDLFFDNKLSKHYMSENEKHIRPGPVKRIVGSVFGKEVFDVEANVLVYLSNGTCNSCEERLEFLTKMANKFKDEKMIKFVEINPETNQHPDLKAHYMPQLAVYRHENKHKPIEFRKAWTEELFKEFVEETVGITLEDEGDFKVSDL